MTREELSGVLHAVLKVSGVDFTADTNWPFMTIKVNATSLAGCEGDSRRQLEFVRQTLAKVEKDRDQLAFRLQEVLVALKENQDRVRKCYDAACGK